MSSIFFSDLSGVESETGLSMQSLLDSQSSADHLGNLGSDSVSDPCHGNNIADLSLDDCDVFQCGKCQKLFTSFAQFINHKKLHGSAAVEGGSKTSLSESVVLSDTDILSFSIDQNDLNSHVLTAVPAHSLFTTSESAITNLQLNAQENSLTENIFAAQMDNEKGEVLFNAPSATNQIFVTAEDSNYLSSSPLLSTIQTNEAGERTVAVSIVEVIQDGENSSLNPASVVGSSTITTNAPSVERKKQLCPFCSKPFFTTPDLELHAQSHTGERPYECIVCSRTFTQKPHLRKHMKSHKVWPKGACKVTVTEPNQCSFCAEIFLTPNELKSHRLTHLNLKVYKCSQRDCEWASQDLNAFLDHVTSHEVNVCYICKRSYATPDELSVHHYIEHEQINETSKTPTVVSIVEVIQDAESAGINSVSNVDTNSISLSEVGEQKKNMLCPYCNKVFFKNFDLEQHIRSHTGERPFQCIVCGRAFTQKSHVKKHMGSHKVWPCQVTTLVKNEVLTDSSKSNAIDRSFACQFCREMFSTFRELKTHHRSAHEDRKVYRCIQSSCEWTSPDLEAFLEHLSDHNDEAMYSCHICNKTFSSLDDFGVHQYYHEISPGTVVAKRFYCKKCKRKFYSQKLLQHHYQQESHRHPCPVCSRVFTAERFLRKHLMIHGEGLPFKCKVCNKGFKTAQYLDRHQSVHTSDWPFPCPQCSQKFKRKDRLKRHLLLHESTKRYKCSFRALLGCDKEFHRKDKLKEHILTHYKSDRTHCDICGKDCKRFSALMKHRKECATNQENKDEMLPAFKAQIKRPSLKQRKDLMSRVKRFDETSASLHNDNVPTIEIVVMPVNKNTSMVRKLACMKLGSRMEAQSSDLFTLDARVNNESVDSITS